MPDHRRHRGKHPEDDQLFHEGAIIVLKQAVTDYCWLLTRNYSEKSAIKLVGDHFNLTVRQRMAIARAACSDRALSGRKEREVQLSACKDQPLAIDGFNLLITLESALSDGLILIGRDGCYRDLAGIHGTYHKVEETRRSLDMIIAMVNVIEPSSVSWFLDQPVSNSGRLRNLILDMLASAPETSPVKTPWMVQLVESPDRALREFGGVVATSDSAILDQVARWTNLAGGLIRQLVPAAWSVDFSSQDQAGQAILSHSEEETAE